MTQRVPLALLPGLLLDAGLWRAQADACHTNQATETQDAFFSPSLPLYARNGHTSKRHGGQIEVDPTSQEAGRACNQPRPPISSPSGLARTPLPLGLGRA